MSEIYAHESLQLPDIERPGMPDLETTPSVVYTPRSKFDYEMDLNFTHYVLYKRLCYDTSHGSYFRASMSPPLSFNCVHTEDFTSKSGFLDLDVISAIQEWKRKEESADIEAVLKNMRVFFNHCEVDDNFELFNGEQLKNMRSLEPNIDDNIFWFNFNRKPCCQGALKSKLPKQQQLALDEFFENRDNIRHVESANSDSVINLRNLDSALAFLIGYAGLIDKNDKVNFKFIQADVLTLLGLRWKLTGHLGEAATCLRAAVQTTQFDETYVSTVNPLGILASSIYLYDRSESLEITKKLLNFTLVNAYRGRAVVQNLSKKRDISNVDLRQVQVMDYYDLLSPGMCSSLLSLFKMIVDRDVTIITDKEKEWVWEKDINTDNISLGLAKWFLSLWETSCENRNDIDYRTYRNSEIKTLINNVNYDFKSMLYIKMKNLYTRKLQQLQLRQVWLVIFMAFLVICWFIPNSEQEETRREIFESRMNNSTKTSSTDIRMK